MKKIMDHANILEDDEPSYIFERENCVFNYDEKFVDLDVIVDKIDFNNYIYGEYSGSFIDENRIRRKQIELGIKIKPGEHAENSYVVTRYGRSLLHEAVAMKDITLIEKYSKDKKLLSAVDNNFNTPLQMALVMDYKEAIDILKPLD